MDKKEQGIYKTHSQDQLGWQYALEGVLMTQWCTQQEWYWQWIKSQCSARWWTAELIKKLWNVAWDMWRHQNSALYETEAQKVLIAEGNINKRVIQVHMAGTQNILREDLPILQIPLNHLIAGSLVYKQQWLESMEAANTRFQKTGTRPEKMTSHQKVGRVPSPNFKNQESINRHIMETQCLKQNWRYQSI